MAERRMIHKKASVSGDLAELHAKHGGDALAFYLLMIPHFDRWGCVPDDPAKLRAMVVPMIEGISAADIKTWVAWMVKRGMLLRITGPRGDRGLRSPDFHEHQSGTNFDREAVSPYEPDEVTKQWTRHDTKRWQRAGESGPGQDQVKTRSGPGRSKGRERKGSKTSLSLPQTPSLSKSAAASPDPSPGAQAQPPEAEVNGNGHRGAAVMGGEPSRIDIAALAESSGSTTLRALAARRGGQT